MVSRIIRLAVCALALALFTTHSISGQSDRSLSRAGSQPGRRLALIVGNDSYPASPLRNARNDARAMATALRDLGFTVRAIEDADRSVFASEIARLGDQLGPDDVVFFFFSGHGVQLNGENYLIPVDFNGDSPTSTRLTALAATEVQQALAKARISLIVLDACRNNPYAGQRAVGTGLAPMEGRGSLIAFATGAGQTASDNPQAQNGLFTQELLSLMREQTLSARDLFFRVRERVYTASQGRQFPAVYDGLIGDVGLRVASPSAPTPSSAAATPTSTGPSADLLLRAELTLWDSVTAARGTAGEQQLLQEYKRLYATGRFATVADVRLAELARPTPPASGTTGTSRTDNTGQPSSLRSSPGAQWIQHHVVKGQSGDYVPFSIRLSPGLMTSRSVAMYIRAVDQGTPGELGKRPPWENVYFRTVAELRNDQSVWRGAIQLEPGVYRVTVALMPADVVNPDQKARQPFVTALVSAANGSPNTSSPISVLDQSLELPSFNSGNLTTSSVILASSVTQAAPLATGEQEKQPYVFGPMRIVPLPDRPVLSKSNELSTIFWIYNAAPGRAGKPDVSIEYSFFQVTSSGPKYFNKTAPQNLNASTLPAEFSTAAGHQLPGSLVVPLASFPTGEYELQIRIRDNVSGNEIMHRVPFSLR